MICERKPGRYLGLAAALLVGLMSVACSTGGAATCQQQTQRAPGSEPTAALLVLADGRSDALVRELDQLAQNPRRVFGSSVLGLGESTGTVVLATYDRDGQLVEQGRFDLSGRGVNDARREADARRNAACLREAVAALPPAEGGKVFSVLPTAAALAAREASGKPSAVAVFGLSRAVGEGFELASVDLGSAEQRRSVLDTLEGAGIVRPLDQRVGAVVFVAPTDGMTNAISAAALDQFASDLCARLGVSCQSSEVLG